MGNNHIVDTNKKVSSVEWLIKKLQNRQNGIFDGFPHLSLDKIYEQAKAMHKEEIEEAFANGADDEYEYQINNEPRKNTEKYYNDTYGND